MGIWSTGLYSNDIALDVKDICNDVFAFLSVEEGNRILLNEFSDLISRNVIDNEYASFWYALADWQWEHGILCDHIRETAIQLANNYAGIEEWELIGNVSDVIKRKRTLDNLGKKLRSPLPIKRIPRKKIAKPKHKPGDIIVFSSVLPEGDMGSSIWRIDRLPSPWLYKSDIIRTAQQKSIVDFNGQNKYYAIICVGTVKIQHSEYIPEVFDEYSVYAFYNYCDIFRPTLEQLRNCGFLPALQHEYDVDAQKIVNIGWTYQFYTFASFKANKTDGVCNLKRMNDGRELTRFQNLVEAKNTYPNIPLQCTDICSAFFSFFAEKVRLGNLGIEIDTLMANNLNPELIDEIGQESV